MATSSRGKSGRPFIFALLVVAAGALAVRLLYALALAPDLVGLDDDSFFHQAALELADGNGYVGTLDVFTSGEKQPTADHPPLYPLLLSFLGRLGARSVEAQRMLGVCAGTLTVVAVGLIARRLAGPRAGLTAAVLCALYPAFIAADGALMSETLFGTLVAFSLLQALILLERPTSLAMAVLGLLVGLAALTRSEGLLLLPLLAIPVIAAAPAHRLRLLGTLAAVAALVIAPWVVRNWEVFGEPVYSTNDGATLAGANCEATYYGEVLGGFSFDCVVAAPQPRTENRAVRARHLRSAALDYAGDHPGRAFVIGAVRLARLWGFYEPEDQTHVTGRDETMQRMGVLAYYAVLVAGLGGGVLVLRRRRKLVLGVMLAPLVVASFAALTTYGLLRLRHICEVSLLALAGVAVTEILVRRARPAPGRRRAANV